MSRPVLRRPTKGLASSRERTEGTWRACAGRRLVGPTYGSFIGDFWLKSRIGMHLGGSVLGILLGYPITVTSWSDGTLRSTYLSCA